MTVNIAKMLPENEYEIIFCLVSWLKHGRGDSSIRDFIPADVSISEIIIRSQFDYLRKLLKKMKEVRPDYVFCSTMPNNVSL